MYVMLCVVYLVCVFSIFVYTVMWCTSIVMVLCGYIYVQHFILYAVASLYVKSD